MCPELLANVSVLRDFLLFRDKPDICSHLFDTDKIATFIKCIYTGMFARFVGSL